MHLKSNIGFVFSLYSNNKRFHIIMLTDNNDTIFLRCRSAVVLLECVCLLAHSGVQHILCCVFVLFVFVLCILCCRFSLNCLFFISPSVFSKVYLIVSASESFRGDKIYWREKETQGQHFRWFNIIYSNVFFSINILG